MKIVLSKNGAPIRIPDERISHITSGHPEMDGQADRIVETLEMPEIILEGDSGELIAVRKYDRTPVTLDKYLVTVYRETSGKDGFLITAYYARRYSQTRRILWKR